MSQIKASLQSEKDEKAKLQKVLETKDKEKELSNKMMEGLKEKIKSDLEKKVQEITDQKKKVEDDLQNVNKEIKCKDTENKNLAQQNSEK